MCCFVLPVTLATIAGLAEPVVLDRTFTLFAWAPPLAIGVLVDRLAGRRRLVAALAVVVLLALVVPSTVTTVTAATGPNAPVRHLERVVRAGDVVAVRPASKAPELQWSLGAQQGRSIRRVSVPGLHHAYAMTTDTLPRSGRVWLLDWRSYPVPATNPPAHSAHRWSWGHTHLRCLWMASKPAAH